MRGADHLRVMEEGELASRTLEDVVGILLNTKHPMEMMEALMELLKMQMCQHNLGK